MGIAGGALIPLLYGISADMVHPQQAYWIIVLCYLFIWFLLLQAKNKNPVTTVIGPCNRVILALGEERNTCW